MGKPRRKIETIPFDGESSHNHNEASRSATHNHGQQNAGIVGETKPAVTGAKCSLGPTATSVFKHRASTSAIDDMKERTKDFDRRLDRLGARVERLEAEIQILRAEIERRGADIKIRQEQFAELQESSDDESLSSVTTVDHSPASSQSSHASSPW